MAAGWGRRAASRIDRTQFGQDELLKSLGQQFNLDFSSYDQWERKKPSQRPPAPPPRPKEQGLPFLVSKPDKSTDTKKAVSYREKRQAVKQQEDDKRRWERMTILELRIQTRNRMLLQYKKRAMELLQENLKLKSEIEGSESETLDGVKRLLRKYERYRGGMAALNKNFVIELKEAYDKLEATRLQIDTELKVLEKQVEEVDGQLKAYADELQVLNSYKDKEYPVKAILITNLQKEIETLQSSNQEDTGELEHIITTEVGKYEKEKVRVTNEITRNVTEEAVGMMHPTLKDMALQNLVMKKEIEFHKKEQASLRENNQVLEEEVKRLLQDPKTNVRQQMFPEFYRKFEKCRPEMDVVLDIPIQEWLPI